MSDNKNTELNQGAAGEETYSAAMREAISAIDASHSLSEPLKRAVDDLLGVAAQSVGSADGSVLIRDGNEGGLKFLVAVSELEEELLKIRIPPGKGIAGLVFSSGQPMAVNDVSEEGSFWSQADKKRSEEHTSELQSPDH